MTPDQPTGDQKFGRIARNQSVNAMIYRCFEHIDADDAKKFVRLFHAQASDRQLFLHTFRELTLGGFLSSQGLRMRSNFRIDGQTPDWSEISATGDAQIVVETLSFHPPRILERVIEAVAHAGVWVGRMPRHTPRLLSALEDKAIAYKGIVEPRGIPYVIGLYSEFTAGVQPAELNECLFHSEHGLFGAHPLVSGVMFFEERFGVYQFRYIANPGARHPVVLPEGELAPRPYSP